MAYRRAISTRATLLARSRFSPSFPYIHHDDDCRNHQDPKVSPFQQRAYGSYVNRTDIDTLFQRQRCFHPFSSPMTGSSIGRHMSTMNNSGPDKNELFTDVAEVLGDQTVEAVTAAVPAVSEVAIAAADSAFPVAALQYLIDNVHSFTGLNWWSSIVVTTLLIRGAMIPLLINQLKSTTKLSLLRPHLEEIKVEMQEKSMDPDAVADGQRRMSALFKEYGVTPFTPLKGLLLQGPIFISFFLAINNMVEKVPSFKHGGMSWFTDLTTPDSLYILPALTALSFWITVESNMQEGMEGNPAANTMKKVSRVFAVLTVPITMNFPKALFCYWVTSNLFSLSYGLVLKAPGVKKFLGVPEIPVEPPRPTSTTTPQYSFFEAMKKYAEATQARAVASRVETAKPAVETPKSEAADERLASSPVSQKLKLLERQVKLRKKNKKR